MNIQIHDAHEERDRRLWEAFVSRCPDAAIGHRWGFRSIYEQVFGYRSHYLMAKVNGCCRGILPLVCINSYLFRRRFLVSLPFHAKCGILADGPDIAHALLSHAKTLARNRQVEFLELRQTAAPDEITACMSEHCYQVLPISGGPDRMWRGLKAKVRNQVRKAIKSGLTVDSGSHLLDEFYQVYARNMRDLAFPVFGKRYFSSLLAMPAPRVSFIVVRSGHKAVGAMLLVADGRTLTDYYASTLRAYNSLCPNMLLYWEAIRRAANTGCHSFDFGRSQWRSSTFRFKSQWGTRAVPLLYCYPVSRRRKLPSVAATGKKYHRIMAIWKRMPVAVANRIGPMVRRNIPF